MFSYFEKRHNGMAFTTQRDSFARSAAFQHAESTLNDWLDGRKKLYAVEWAMREIKALFFEGGTIPCELIGQAVALDADDPRRLQLVTKALDLLRQRQAGDFD